MTFLIILIFAIIISSLIFDSGIKMRRMKIFFALAIIFTALPIFREDMNRVINIINPNAYVARALGVQFWWAIASYFWGEILCRLRLVYCEITDILAEDDEKDNQWLKSKIGRIASISLIFAVILIHTLFITIYAMDMGKINIAIFVISVETYIYIGFLLGAVELLMDEYKISSSLKENKEWLFLIVLIGTIVGQVLISR